MRAGLLRTDRVRAPMNATANATTDRRRTILELLEEHDVASQGQLLELLSGRGFAATQPQLSRDLRALHVAKRDGVYKPSERVTPLDALAVLLRDARAAGPNLVVVRCEPGAASAIARALEAEEVEGLVGTVAGDDTVFVAVLGEASGGAIRRWIEGMIE